MTASLLDSMLLSYKNRNEIMLSTDIRMPLYITNFLTVVHRVQIFQLMQRFQNKKGTQASQVSIAPVRKCGGIFWECAPLLKSKKTDLNQQANRDDVATTGTAENFKKNKIKSDSFLYSTQNYVNITMICVENAYRCIIVMHKLKNTQKVYV